MLKEDFFFFFFLSNRSEKKKGEVMPGLQGSVTSASASIMRDRLHRPESATQLNLCRPLVARSISAPAPWLGTRAPFATGLPGIAALAFSPHRLPVSLGL